MFGIIPILALFTATPSPTPQPAPVIVTGCKSETDSRKSGIVGSLVSSVLGRSTQPVVQGVAGSAAAAASRASISTHNVVGLQSASKVDVVKIRLLIGSGTKAQDVTTSLPAHGFISVSIAGACPASVIMVERADGSFWFPPSK